MIAHKDLVPLGRVGDSPIIGAGTWADTRCAVSGTLSKTNDRVGVNRTPVPAPTLLRSAPLARSSAAAAPA